jgi:hypothetical protein
MKIIYLIVLTMPINFLKYNRHYSNCQITNPTKANQNPNPNL